MFVNSVVRRPGSVKSQSSCAYHLGVRERPDLLERLPEQYFAALVGRVAALSTTADPVIDLGRGNPESGPPGAIAEELAFAAMKPDGHGYAPFRGLARLREAIAERYRRVYGVSLDPELEVAIVPGTKTAIVELALSLASPGETILLPDPYYPDYLSAVAFADAEVGLLHLDPDAGWQPNFDLAPAAAVCFLNFPSNPCGSCVADGTFEAAVSYAERTGTPIVHDAAYIDLVFDGRKPTSFLATLGAREVGVELFTMSKSYGMAGWRVGFVLGNREIVARVNLLSEHTRVGMLAPIQAAAALALEVGDDSVVERRLSYQRRRDKLIALLPGRPSCEGSFYVWWRLPPGVTVERLLAEQRVALAPGEGFGPSGAGYARVSLAVADAELERGLERLQPALAASST